MNQNIDFSYIGKLTEGLIRFKIGICPKYKCGFIDVDGNVVIEPIYTNAQNFKNGYSIVKLGHWADGKWGVINKKGELVIDYLFDRIFPFSDNRAKVRIDNQWYFINEKGEILFSINQYLRTGNYHNGYTIVEKKTDDIRLFGIIDVFGNEVVPCKVDCFSSKTHFFCSNLSNYIKLYNDGYYDDFIIDI